MIDWLSVTISGSHAHWLASEAAWHGRLMVLAWSILSPIGILAARFGKVMPSQNWPALLDNRAWWHAHRLLQGAALGFATVGLALIMFGGGRGEGAASAVQAHRLLGFTLLAAAVLQAVGGVLRGSKGGPTDTRMRGDHFDMTPRRVWFERLHKSIGWLTVPLAVATTALGLVIADAPRWMPVVIAGWWLILAGVFIRLQRRGHCLDTYQAIWGPDPALPGNQREPIGWGVRREACQDVTGD